MGRRHVSGLFRAIFMRFFRLFFLVCRPPLTCFCGRKDKMVTMAMCVVTNLSCLSPRTTPHNRHPIQNSPKTGEGDLHKMKSLLLLSVTTITFVSIILGFVAGQNIDTNTTTTTNGNILEVASTIDGLDTFLATINAAGLVDILSEDGPFSVFAPSDTAFDNLPVGLVRYLFLEKNVEILSSIVQYHIIRSSGEDEVVRSSTILDSSTFTSLEGGQLVLSVSTNGRTRIMVNGGAIIEVADISATNGIIHLISHVLVPFDISLPLSIVDTALTSGQYPTFLSLLDAAELVDDLQVPGPFTVFIPNENAFLSLPTGVADWLSLEDKKDVLVSILLYHVVFAEEIRTTDISGQGISVDTIQGELLNLSTQGRNFLVNGIIISSADTVNTNGIFHSIDQVLIPDNVSFPSSIVETATSLGMFTTLLALLEATGLLEILNAPGSTTVFAPSDEAFSQLPPGTLNYLLRDENAEALFAILGYHLVAGRFSSGDLVDGVELETLEGSSLLEFSGLGRIISVNNGAMLVDPIDIDAINGVLHTIDQVIIPESVSIPLDIVGTAIESGNFSTLMTALITSELVPDLLQVEDGSQFTIFMPIDDAWLKFPPGMVDALLLEENRDTLRSILLYHIVGGVLPLNPILEGLPNVNTLQVGILEFSIDSGNNVMVNEAVIVSPDIENTNGYIHAIDRVLIPNMLILPDPLPVSVIEFAAGSGFDTLMGIVEAAELTEFLRGEGPFTLFAPTDEAFKSLPPGAFEFLLMEDNFQSLDSILRYHIVSGEFASSNIIDGTTLLTLEGGMLGFSKANETFTVMGGAKRAIVGPADILAQNGVVHVVDHVLLPGDITLPRDIIDTAILSTNFPTLINALTTAGLDEHLRMSGPFTVLAPSENAFSKLPSGTIELLLAEENREILTSILLFHVVSNEMFSSDDILDGLSMATTLQGQALNFSLSGEGDVTSILVGTAKVALADIVALNGVIHVIDEVLIPDGVTLPAGILATAENTGIFTILLEAVEAANLVNVLSENGPLTLFAPTDDAFNYLPQGSVAYLLRPENIETLVDILQYHIVASELRSRDLEDSSAITTLEGGDLVIVASNGTITVNDVLVDQVDISAYNGIIHIVDRVLLPPRIEIPLDIVSTISVSRISSSFEEYLALVGLEDALRMPGEFTVFAPSDEAFALITSQTPGSIVNIDLMRSVILYHIVPEIISTNDIMGGRTGAVTLQGSTLDFSVMNGNTMVNTASIILANITARNGIIHVVDSVMIPRLATETPTKFIEPPTPSPARNPGTTDDSPTFAPAASSTRIRKPTVAVVLASGLALLAAAL